MRIGSISIRLGLANGLDVPVVCQMLCSSLSGDCSRNRLLLVLRLPFWLGFSHLSCSLGLITCRMIRSSSESFNHRGLDQLDLIKASFTIICFNCQYPDIYRSVLTPGLDWLFKSRCKSRPGEPTTARTNIYTCLCMQANCRKHVRSFLIRYRSGGTPCISGSIGVCQDLGR